MGCAIYLCDSADLVGCEYNFRGAGYSMTIWTARVSGRPYPEWGALVSGECVGAEGGAGFVSFPLFDCRVEAGVCR